LILVDRLSYQELCLTSPRHARTGRNVTSPYHSASQP